MALMLSKNCVGVIYEKQQRTSFLSDTKRVKRVEVRTYASLKLRGIRRGKLHNLASGIVPFHTNDLPRMVHANLSHRWRKVRRVLRRRSKIVRRHRHTALRRRPVKWGDPKFGLPLFLAFSRAEAEEITTHGFGTNVDSPITTCPSDVGDGPDSHGRG
jgi:hypothetical protein